MTLNINRGHSIEETLTLNTLNRESWEDQSQNKVQMKPISSSQLQSIQNSQNLFLLPILEERLQMNFNKSGAFSIKRAWPPAGWYSAQFLSWFKELYIRAFKLHIICVRISLIRLWNLKDLKSGWKHSADPVVYKDSKNSFCNFFDWTFHDGFFIWKNDRLRR